MLQGTRVIEIEGLGPGPFAAMMLADLGAEVIVIHRPGASNPVAGEKNLLDRGKKSITLDLKHPDDLATARALIASADALIEGFRPGVMERLGLDPERCHADNPGLVYGRMTGWGQTGPKSQMAGHDLNYIATSGALWYASPPGTAPLAPPTLVGDIGGGAMYLVAGLLAGLLNAARTGQGTVVDAAITDGSAHMMALLMSMAPSGQLSPMRGRSLLDGPHWARTYQCACGGYISVQCLEPKFYAAFLALMGLADDPDFADRNDADQWPAQTARLAALFVDQPRDHWEGLFEGSDACVAPVLSPQEAAQDAHNAARQNWVMADGMQQPAPAPRFDGQAIPPGPIPARGEDGVALRAELKARGQI